MRIAVIGCGVGGMAAALGLKRGGHEVEIFERFEEPKPVGAGLLLQPTGLSALAHLGLEDRVRALGAKVTGLLGRNRRGRAVFDLPYERGTGLGVQRSALFGALYDTVRAEKIEVHAGTGIEAIDGADDEHARLRDETGRSWTGYDLVVVADGANSQLRSNVRPSARAPAYPWGAFWTLAPDPDNAWSDLLRQVYDGARIMAGVLPVGRAPAAQSAADPKWGAEPGSAPDADGATGSAVPQVAFFWSVKTADFDKAREKGLDALKAEVSALWPEAGALLSSADSFDAFAPASYRNVAARPWTRGRLVVIGDAAHGTSPQLGQGANLALIDAVELAWAIGEARRYRPLKAALRDYVRARSAHTAYYQFMSWMLTPVYQSDSRLMGWTRDIVMPILCGAPLTGNVMRATLCGRARFGLGRWRGSWER
ncbi:MAG: NAD(P)/FAD-dependent oxidoreductase [Maricaulaceae bacterium]|jgi:2-polyprenyl-6-methoxyphenol hydroxylase-like FAD-dependent oxidoreductase